MCVVSLLCYQQDGVETVVGRHRMFFVIRVVTTHVVLGVTVIYRLIYITLMMEYAMHAGIAMPTT